MRLDERYRWTVTLGLGALTAIGAGTIAGQQVVDQLDPFYANLAAREGITREPEIVATSFVAPSDPPIATTDLSYGSGDAPAGGDGAAETR